MTSKCYLNKVAIMAFVLLIAIPVRAHLMESQHGTLNMIDQDVFMVLSLPVSAIENIDTNHDGQISIEEFDTQRPSIAEKVKSNVMLVDKDGELALRGFLLSPVLPHSGSSAALSQFIVMGRFTVNNPNEYLRFHLGLFGNEEPEQTQQITAIRHSDRSKQVLLLTPTVREVEIIF